MTCAFLVLALLLVPAAASAGAGDDVTRELRAWGQQNQDRRDACALYDQAARACQRNSEDCNQTVLDQLQRECWRY